MQGARRVQRRSNVGTRDRKNKIVNTQSCENDWSGDTHLRLIAEKANFANGGETISGQSFGQERLEFLEFVVKDWWESVWLLSSAFPFLFTSQYLSPLITREYRCKNLVCSVFRVDTDEDFLVRYFDPFDLILSGGLDRLEDFGRG